MGELCNQFGDGFCGLGMGWGEIKDRREGRTAVAVEDALDGLEVPCHFLARLKRAMGCFVGQREG